MIFAIRAMIFFYLMSNPTLSQTDNNCQIFVTLGDDRVASIEAISSSPEWYGGEYMISISVRNGSNQSNSVQGGPIGSAARDASVVTLARSVISLPPGSEAEITLVLRNGAREARCQTQVSG
jgi:hypothetical protein